MRRVLTSIKGNTAALLGQSAESRLGTKSARKHLSRIQDGVIFLEWLLDENQYSYVLLDLEIPVRSGRGLPRIQNGQDLLAEIIDRFGKQVPVIIMTGHGTNTPVLAVEIMKLGVFDYVTKPFPTTSKTGFPKLSGTSGTNRSNCSATRRTSSASGKTSSEAAALVTASTHGSRSARRVAPKLAPIVAQLKKWGMIEFVGPPRTGHYQLKKQPTLA